jgi:hypothetical protein
MPLFAKRPTPSDCVTRISNAMNEVEAISAMLDVTPQGKHYRADWDTNRQVACDHLTDAWQSIGSALSSVMRSEHHPTRMEEQFASIEMERAVSVLKAEVQRLNSLLTMSEIQLTAYVASAAKPRADGQLAQKLRRAVIQAVHPDKTTDAAEGEWRTKLCQTLLPEIDRLLHKD